MCLILNMTGMEVKCSISRIILTPDGREKVGEYTVKYNQDVSMNAEDFLACLDAISETGSRTLNEDVIKKSLGEPA